MKPSISHDEYMRSAVHIFLESIREVPHDSFYVFGNETPTRMGTATRWIFHSVPEHKLLGAVAYDAAGNTIGVEKR